MYNWKVALKAKISAYSAVWKCVTWSLVRALLWIFVFHNVIFSFLFFSRGGHGQTIDDTTRNLGRHTQPSPKFDFLSQLQTVSSRSRLGDCQHVTGRLHRRTRDDRTDELVQVVNTFTISVENSQLLLFLLLLFLTSREPLWAHIERKILSLHLCRAKGPPPRPSPCAKMKFYVILFKLLCTDFTK